MTSRQETKSNMYGAVITFCDENTAITDPVAAFETTLDVFKAKKSEIDETVQLEAQVISGIAANKRTLKKATCASGEVIATAVYAYATSINDEELQAKADYTESSLLKFKDDELPSKVQNLHDAASAVIASLATYGITAPILATFQTSITQYSNKVSAPRNATALRKAYGAQLRVLYKEADDILKTQLDKIVVQFKATQPEFYEAYFNNRMLVNAPTTATQVKGLITDNATASPIYNVVITVFEQEYTTTSELDGTYSLKIPVPGIYTILYNKPGYQIHQSTNVELLLG